MYPPRREQSSWDPSLSPELVEELLDIYLSASTGSEEGGGGMISSKKAKKKKVKQEKVSEAAEVTLSPSSPSEAFFGGECRGIFKGKVLPT